MKKVKAYVYSCVPSVDEEGRTVRELTLQGTASGVILPVSSELAAKDFGFDENISHRLFCKEKNPFITAGNVIKYNEKDYNIVHVADYGKIRVVHLNTLIGRQNVRSVVQSLRY